MRSAEHLTLQDVDHILEEHSGNALFERALRQTSSEKDLLRLLGQYIEFNSVFGGGVANLAGRVAARRALFSDPDEAVTAFADRSSEVASTIFYAAIDEFGDPTKPHRVTHRTMAQATLRAAAEFMGYSPLALDGLLQPDLSTQVAVRKVLQG